MATWIGDFLSSIGTLIAALAALITAFVSGIKTRAEIKSVHRRLTQETNPDHGATLRDAIDRIEQAQHENTKQMSGMARDVGRLADADQRIEMTAHDEHERIHARIDRIERQIGE